MPKEIKVKIGEKISEVLVRSGLAKSKREALYFIKAGAIRLIKGNPHDKTSKYNSDSPNQ